MFAARGETRDIHEQAMVASDARFGLVETEIESIEMRVERTLQAQQPERASGAARALSAGTTKPTRTRKRQIRRVSNIAVAPNCP